jgi:hypothetical protein
LDTETGSVPHQDEGNSELMCTHLIFVHSGGYIYLGIFTLAIMVFPELGLFLPLHCKLGLIVLVLAANKLFYCQQTLALFLPINCLGKIYLGNRK